MLPSLKLYHYWRSSSSWRVRWAFALKGIECEFVPVSLLDGEAEGEAHRKRNPLGYVPVLEMLKPGESHPTFLTESMAIMEWAEEVRPAPSLFYGDPERRAQIRQLAEIINSGTQPIQNPTVLDYYSDDPEKKKAWARHWIHNGLSAYETWVSRTAGHFSVGNQLTLADLCLIPQCYNARRFGVELEAYPTIARIFETAQDTEGYRNSEPGRFEPAGS